MERLTPRQLQFVALRCGDGCSIEEASVAMRLARQTAKNYVRGILDRLGLRTFHQVCTAYGAAQRPAPPAVLRARDV